MSRGCHRKIQEEGHPDRFAKLPLAGQESHLLRAEVAALEQGRGVKSRLSMARGESAWARRPAVNGVQVGEAATGSEEGESFGVIGSHVVVAVIAVVACNACNARIAGHCKQEGVCATCNDVVVCPSRSSIVIGHWSFGSKMDCAAVRCAGGWGYERNRMR